MAAQLLVDAAEQARSPADRQPPGDPPETFERGLAAALGDLALDGAPEQVEDLRDHDHRGDPVVAQRVEDDPRVAAPDIQDVRPDRERVVQPDRLLEQVRQRQQRDDPVLHRRDQAVERLDRRDLVVVGEHDALRAAGRAGGEDELEDIAAGGRIPAGELGLPVLGERVVWIGRDRAERRRREAVQAGFARIRGVAALTEDEMACARDADDAFDCVGRHAQVERDQDEAGAHRAEIRCRQLGGRGRPGQQPIAGFETEGSKPPCRDPGSTIELAVAPRGRRTVVEPEAQRRLVAVGGDRVGKQVEKGLQTRPPNGDAILRRATGWIVTRRASGPSTRAVGV